MGGWGVDEERERERNECKDIDVCEREREREGNENKGNGHHSPFTNLPDPVSELVALKEQDEHHFVLHHSLCVSRAVCVCVC